MSVVVIINPIAGGASPERARSRAELASSLIDRHGEAAEVFVTERRGHARDLAKAAVGRGVRMVMAWGGDGTINEVASALAFGSAALGIIPAGSGNGLARELGISAKPQQAMADALDATPRAMDLGELDGHLFANIAGVGFDACIAERFDAAKSGRRGLVTYVGVTVQILGSYVPERYTVALGDQSFETRAILVTFANSAQFGNGALIAPGAKVDDGLLDLVIVEERSRWRTIGHLPHLFRGTVNQVPGCSIRRIERATIESDRPMLYHVDGEPFQGGTKLQGRVHPGALLVAVK